MIDVLILCAAVLLQAAVFTLQKLYQKRTGSDGKTSMTYTMLLGVLTAVIFFAYNGFRVQITPFSLLCAFAVTAPYLWYMLLGFRILATGNLALYTLTLMSGGMLLPYIFGLIFLDEPFSWLRLAGLFLILLALVLSNLPQRAAYGKNNVPILSCVGVFLLGGVVNIASKLHQIEAVRATVSVVDFIILTALMKAILSLAVLAAAGLRRCGSENQEQRRKFGRKEIAVLGAILVGVVLSDAISYACQLRSAVNLPATMQYPFLTGGSVVLSALCGVLFFKDKLTLRTIIGTIVCFIGTLLFL